VSANGASSTSGAANVVTSNVRKLYKHSFAPSGASTVADTVTPAKESEE
jgi:hypothetical protein